MDSAHRAKLALEAKKLPEAIELYTKALTESPTSPVYLIGRSTAYQRSHENEKALEDAERAVVYARQRAKRELIAQAQLRRAIALFGLQQYGNAKACLEWSEKFNDKEKTLPIWTSKVETQLKGLAADDEKAQTTALEAPEVSAPKPAEPQKAASNGESTRTTKSDTSTPDTASAQTPREKIRHDWYQSNDSVTVSLMVKGVPKDKASIEIEANSLSISFPLATGSDFNFSLDPLFATIDSSTSTSKILSTKIEIILKKAEPGLKWKGLEGSPNETSESKPASAKAEPTADKPAISAASSTGPSYPTSSRNGPKDWDKIASTYGKTTKKKSTKGKEKKETEAEDDEDDGYESGADDPNFFFKKLYAGASDDVKRAMMKSYQESGGTTLSTNWSEVSKAPVPVDPPDGMEAHEWEKAKSKSS